MWSDDTSRASWPTGSPRPERNYRRRKVAAIRSLFAFLEDRGLIPASPARKLLPPERGRHQSRHQSRYLTELEYKRLPEAVRHEPRTPR